MQNEYYAYAKGATTKDDKSLREALRDCGWEDPNPGSLNETIEWSYLDFPVSTRAFFLVSAAESLTTHSLVLEYAALGKC